MDAFPSRFHQFPSSPTHSSYFPYLSKQLDDSQLDGLKGETHPPTLWTGEAAKLARLQTHTEARL